MFMKIAVKFPIQDNRLFLPSIQNDIINQVRDYLIHEEIISQPLHKKKDWKTTKDT